LQQQPGRQEHKRRAEYPLTEAGINLLLPLPPLDGGVGGWERCTTPTPPFFKDKIIPPEEGVAERLADRLRMEGDGLTARVH